MAARTQPRTIALITRDGADRFVEPFETGGQSAATTLGDQLTIATADDPVTEISTIKSLVAEHVAAIAIDTRDPATVKQVLPALAKARAAGVPTFPTKTRFPGSPWVNLTSPTQFVHALADSLASQMKQRGQFVIVSCLRSAGAFPIVRTELKLTEAYIKRHYPQMHRVGVAYGDLGNGNVDTHLFNRLLRAHPQMRGLIFLCPGEADNQPPLLVKAHKVGKIFTSGNGDGCPPVDDNWLTSVRLGAEEVVCEGDPAKLRLSDGLGRGLSRRWPYVRAGKLQHRRPSRQRPVLQPSPGAPT